MNEIQTKMEILKQKALQEIQQKSLNRDDIKQMLNSADPELLKQFFPDGRSLTQQDYDYIFNFLGI